MEPLSADSALDTKRQIKEPVQAAISPFICSHSLLLGHLVKLFLASVPDDKAESTVHKNSSLGVVWLPMWAHIPWQTKMLCLGLILLNFTNSWHQVNTSLRHGENIKSESHFKERILLPIPDLNALKTVSTWQLHQLWLKDYHSQCKHCQNPTSSSLWDRDTYPNQALPSR